VGEHRADRRASRYPVGRAIRLRLEIRHICMARFGLPGCSRVLLPAGRGWLSRPPWMGGSFLPRLYSLARARLLRRARGSPVPRT
jgi:hypothetical protein